MGRGRVVAGVALAALVGTVLLVRPGTQAPEDALLTAPSARPSAVPSPAAPPLPRVGELAATPLEDLPVDLGGVGPFRLGAEAEALVSAGWQTVEQPDGCARLRGAPLRDGELLGWALDGEVVSLQVRSTANDPAVPGSGGLLPGRSMDDVVVDVPWADEPLVDYSVPVGDRVVRILERSDGSTSIAVSDLGGGVVRQVEVATLVGRDCGHGPDTLQAEFSVDYASDLPEDLEQLAQAADLLPEVVAVGLPVEEAIAQGVPVTPSTEGCQSVEGIDGRGRDVTTHVRNGVVVGQRVDRADAAGDEVLVEPTAVDGTLVRDLPSGVGVREESGPSLDYELLQREQLVDAVDAGVTTGPPVVRSRQVGGACSGP